MSKINDLIKELCPNGVKYSTLEQETKLNGFKQISANELENMNKGFGYVKLLPSSRNYSWFCDVTEENKNMICCGKVITVGRARHPNIKYCDGQFISSQNHIIQSKDENRLMTKFLYYFLSNCVQDFYNTESSYPLFTKADYNRHRIPIPPLDVQKEIIRILDKFVELEVDLEAELEARKSQYEFWRGKLFDFDNNVEELALEELCNIVDYRGKTPKKVDSGIFLVTAKNIKKGYIDYDYSKEYIAEADFTNVMRRGKANIGDVLFTTEAPCGHVAQVDKDNIALAQRVIKYSSKDFSQLNNKYLKYALLSSQFQNKLLGTSTGATVKGIKGSILHKMTIPVPTIEKQNQIVNILERFETLINDISEGLPAEIELRKQQYEYYRNKLLSFEEYVNE